MTTLSRWPPIGCNSTGTSALPTPRRWSRTSAAWASRTSMLPRFCGRGRRAPTATTSWTRRRSTRIWATRRISSTWSPICETSAWDSCLTLFPTTRPPASKTRTGATCLPTDIVRRSPRWFDIDWRMPDPDMWGRVLVPVLARAPFASAGAGSDSACLVGRTFPGAVFRARLSGRSRHRADDLRVRLG